MEMLVIHQDIHDYQLDIQEIITFIALLAI